MRRDSERADGEGAGRRWRGVPAADRATSPGAAHALLRLLGSFQDAEDALQDTLLAAWRALHRVEGRASIRTWLYRIATNQCLNAIRLASRRPGKERDVPEIEPPEPSRLGEVVWLEPYPDAQRAPSPRSARYLP